jgi:hypothetical protein
VTTAGFVSGTRDDTSPSSASRIAAAGSLLLGGSLLLALPGLAAAAFYVAVLAAATAAVALVTGLLLWVRVTLVARAVAGLVALAALLGVLVDTFLGFPGAAELEQRSWAEGYLAPLLAGTVLVFLGLDAVRRRAEPVPDHPYAL